MLTLRALAYFATAHPAKALALAKAQQRPDDEHYPLAFVAGLVTRMLADVLLLRDARCLMARRACWRAFARARPADGRTMARGGVARDEPRGGVAFFELWCACVRALDALWVARGATRADFTSLMAELKGMVEALLAAEPATPAELLRLAEQNGMIQE